MDANKNKREKKHPQITQIGADYLRGILSGREERRESIRRSDRLF